MEVPPYADHLSISRLEILINIQTPDATPMEKWLITTFLDYNPNLEEMEQMQSDMEEAEGNYNCAKDEISEYEDQVEQLENCVESLEDQIEEWNATFPDDMRAFMKEAAMWQKNNAKWLKASVDSSKQAIRERNIRNRVDSENEGLRLELEMLKSAGFTKEDE